MGQVFERRELLDFLKAKRGSKKVVFTNGCFDLLHVGHVRYLQEARALGDMLVVGLNSDKSVSDIKGPDRPVQTEQDRAEIMAALGCVDAVTIFGELTPLELIQAIQPNILVKGGDWSVDKIVGADVVIKAGGEVKSLPFHPGRSTSKIIEKVLKA